MRSWLNSVFILQWIPDCDEDMEGRVPRDKLLRSVPGHHPSPSLFPSCYEVGSFASPGPSTRMLLPHRLKTNGAS